MIHDEIFRDPKVAGHAPPANTLAFLTYNLCHLWGRATKAVGLAPPAYYADILCERARAYLGSIYDAQQGPAEPVRVLSPGPENEDGRRRTYKYVNELRQSEFDGLEEQMRKMLLDEGEKNRQHQQDLVEVHKNLKDSMFYI